MTKQKKTISKAQENNRLLISVVRQLDKVIQLLKEHKENLLEELNSYPTPITLNDPEGYFIEVNEAYCQLYGFTRDELIGKHFNLIVPEETQSLILDSYSAGVTTDTDYRGTLAEVQHRDGHTFPILYNSVNILLPDSRIARLTVITDLSDLKLAELQVHDTIIQLESNIKELEHLLESQEVAKNALLHDIKKPFQNIIGICQILQSPEVSEAEKKMWLDTVLELSKKGLAQVGTMQGLYQMERGTFHPDYQSIELLGFLQKIINSSESILQSKELVCQLFFNDMLYQPQEEHYIKADRPYLELAVFNLLLNAIEASPPNQSITIKVQTQGQHTVLSIHNHGAVPKAIRQKFFKKYVTAGKQKGTGLGTYIAKLITLTHHGHIEMKSGKKKGTTVCLTFPNLLPVQKAA